MRIECGGVGTAGPGHAGDTLIRSAPEAGAGAGVRRCGGEGRFERRGEGVVGEEGRKVREVGKGSWLLFSTRRGVEWSGRDAFKGSPGGTQK